MTFLKFEKNRHSAGNIVLCGIFMFSVLVAQLMVYHYQKIRVSAPTEIRGCGVSVSLPSGEAWQSDENWTYHGNDNVFAIQSRYAVSKSRAAMVRCLYFLASEPISAQKHISNQINSDGLEPKNYGTVGKTIQFEKFGLVDDPSESGAFYGVADLPDGKKIQLEVHSLMGARFAEKVFDAVANSVELTDSEIFAASTEFVSEIKKQGLINVLNSQRLAGNERAYLIEDASGQTQGHSIEKFSSFAGLAGGVQAAEFYLRTDLNMKENSVFAGSGDLSEFVWKTGQSQSGRRMIAPKTLALNSDGKLQLMGPVSDVEKEFWPGQRTLPGIFLNTIVRKFGDSDAEQIKIEAIFADGKILPVIMSKADMSEVRGVDFDANVLVKVEYIGFGIIEYIYLKRGQSIVGKAVKSRGTSVWRQSTSKQLGQMFGQEF